LAYGDDFDALDIAVGAKLTAVGLTASNCRVVEFVKGVISSTPVAPVAPPMALKPPTAAPVIVMPDPNIVQIFVGCQSTKLASPIRQVTDGSQQRLIADTIMQAFNEVHPTIPLSSVKYIPQPVYLLSVVQKSRVTGQSVQIWGPTQRRQKDSGPMVMILTRLISQWGPN
jgi:hypothetical protein